METLIVERTWSSSYVQQTVFKDCLGHVKQIISSSIKQPKYGLKTVVIRGKQYLLDWRLVEYTTGGKKIKNRK